MSPRRDNEDGGVSQRLVDEVSRAIAAERTPTPVAESSERMKSIAKEAMRDHADFCRDEGPLCSVAEKVDQLRTSFNRWAGAMALVCVLLPVGIALWSNRAAETRATESLRKTIEAAAEVAKQLKAVQEARHGASIDRVVAPTYAQAAEYPQTPVAHR
jgi:hypothetical protein